MFTYRIADAQTGALKLLVNPSSGSFNRVINDVGSGSHTFQLRDSTISRAQWQDLTDPWRRVLLVLWNGRAVYAGTITSRTYDPETGELTVDHNEFRALLTRRFPFGIGSYSTGTLVDGQYALVCPNQSLRGIIYMAAYSGLKGARSLVWDMPVGFPATSEAGPHSRTYFNYKFANIESIISEAQDMEGGPDVDFEPQIVDSALTYYLRVGSAAQPRLDGPTFVYNLAADETGSISASVTDDGSRMVTGVFMTGDGAEADRPHGEAATVAVEGGVPSLDVVRPLNDQKDVSILNAHARAERDTFYRPIRQFNVSGTASYLLGSLRLGSVIRLYSKGDVFLNDGWVNLRCIGYSNDGSETVKLDVQEV